MTLKARLDRLEAQAPGVPSAEDLRAAWDELGRRVEAAHAADDYDELVRCHQDGLRLCSFYPPVDEDSPEYRRLLRLPHDELLRLHRERLGLHGLDHEGNPCPTSTAD